LQDRMARGKQERTAAKLTWEAIQRIELCTSADAAGRILDHAAQDMGCRRVQIVRDEPCGIVSGWDVGDEAVSGPSAIFRLSGGHGRWITMGLSLGAEAPLAADIVFRYMQRLGLALAGRIERLEEARGTEGPADPAGANAAQGTVARSSSAPVAAPARPGLGIATLLRRIGPRGLAARAAGVSASTNHRPAADGLARPHTPARP
jgi:UDP-GlcNAc:undecaprenyl-phosphate/decaprenyl-phosphate GlcNAc-1-phosphate transferase